jgi:predicted AlkP superfamily phosphohydrolase/phosphomutase
VSKPLLVLGLDGFDPDVARALMAQGKLPNLARLESSAHRFRLEHGVEKLTGLAWEQFSGGLSPEECSRWSAITLDTKNYVAGQPFSRLKPFTEDLGIRAAVFDAPYFDLSLCSLARGMVSWGAHDAGVERKSNPPELVNEIVERFGEYPASHYIYGHVWHNPAWAAEMAEKIVAATERRLEISRWLFKERLRDWDVAITVVSEYHSATEALWHGWDESHPLHGQESSEAARKGFIGVYEAGDRLLGEMVDAFPEADVLAFSLHGMGPNLADLPAMLLLPELLYRWSTGREGFVPDPAWAVDGSGSADLENVPNWSYMVSPRVNVQASLLERWRQRKVAAPVPMDWMPAAQYRPAWPSMKAFGMPAYYDGRVRVNLKGRESRGRVAVERYAETLAEVRRLIAECVDLRPGDALEFDVETREGGDPRDRDPSDSDLFVRFKKEYFGFRHPRLGDIGPAPCRRTGGHTGGPGAGWFWNGSGEGGSDLGAFRALDVAHAVGALAGGKKSDNALGRALLSRGC